MGQEQSIGRSSSSSAVSAIQHEGFRIVQPGASSGVGDISDEAIVQEVESLPLPYPVLPPPPVPDDVTSALSGAQVMHELRAAFGSMLPATATDVDQAERGQEGLDQTAGTDGVDGGEDGHIAADRQGQAADDDADTGGSEQAEGVAIGSLSATNSTPVLDGTQAKLAQERWARAVLDISAVESAVSGAGGGDALERALVEQERLLEMVRSIRASAEKVQHAMEATEKEAVRTRKALESLERLRLAVAEVQDGLEAGVATANILGASHFPQDEELRSFKDYLRHHPPDYGDNED